MRTSFDWMGIAVSDLAASERFYRTVLSVLGVRPTMRTPS
jgi:catechol 2,3-dioxygenase-like lactoylglutathione lyase family enzyme